jgi:hypothetical protein
MPASQTRAMIKLITCSEPEPQVATAVSICVNEAEEGDSEHFEFVAEVRGLPCELSGFTEWVAEHDKPFCRAAFVELAEFANLGESFRRRGQQRVGVDNKLIHACWLEGGWSGF